MNTWQNIEAITPEQVTRITEYAERKHEGQTRDSKSINTGQKHGYFDTHVLEVARRSLLFAESLRYYLPQDQKELLDSHPQIVTIIGLLHDTIEDCLSDECPTECKRDEPCQIAKLECLGIRQEVRQELVDAELHPDHIQLIMDDLTALTKDRTITNKDARLKEQMGRIRQRPLLTKFIKLGGDHDHNIETLHARDFESALKNAIKILKCWPLMFTDEEYEALVRAGALPPRKLLDERIKFLEFLYKLKRGEQTLGNFLDAKKYFRQGIEERSRYFSHKIDPESVFANLNPAFIAMHGLNENRSHPNQPRMRTGHFLQKLEETLQGMAKARLNLPRIIHNMLRDPIQAFLVFKPMIIQLIRSENKVLTAKSPYLRPINDTENITRAILECMGLTTTEFLETVQSPSDFRDRLEKALEQAHQTQHKVSCMGAETCPQH